MGTSDLPVLGKSDKIRVVNMWCTTIPARPNGFLTLKLLYHCYRNWSKLECEINALNITSNVVSNSMTLCSVTS